MGEKRDCNMQCCFPQRNFAHGPTSKIIIPANAADAMSLWPWNILLFHSFQIAQQAARNRVSQVEVNPAT
jgi:hypothetical protein